jgi:mRNA interferase RelE/StbE
MAAVLLTDDAKADLRDFDRAAQIRILKALKKLESDPEQRGEPQVRELAGYRKLVVGDREVRVIYTVEKDGSIAVVWIIGRRANDEVYQIARSRLLDVDDSELQATLAQLLTSANEL